MTEGGVGVERGRGRGVKTYGDKTRVYLLMKLWVRGIEKGGRYVRAMSVLSGKGRGGEGRGCGRGRVRSNYI